MSAPHTEGPQDQPISESPELSALFQSVDDIIELVIDQVKPTKEEIEAHSLAFAIALAAYYATNPNLTIETTEPILQAIETRDFRHIVVLLNKSANSYMADKTDTGFMVGYCLLQARDYLLAAQE